MQEEILGKNAGANVKVYAVWLPIISSDARSAWKKNLLPDSRVMHFWDGQRVTGRWFARQAWYGKNVDIAWDIYILFGPEARWDGAPGSLISWGETVVDAREQLRLDFQSLLGG